MPAKRVERRLAAVLAADVAGYSRLMEQDERDTFDRLKAHRIEVLEPLIAEHGGRIVKLTGDGALCEFHSVVDAVSCAVLIQERMRERERESAEGRRIQFRIGINLGDVILEEDGDIYGGGVNVAARIEGLAEPGGICVSGAAYDNVRGLVDCRFEDLGERTLKNIERPVRLYRIVCDAAAAAAEPPPPPVPSRPSIAVLPFSSLGAQSEEDFFAEGITEDITTALCKLKGFFVIARNSTAAYQNRSSDARTVGRELGVRYVLEGSVRRAGERIRVNVQLIEAESGAHLWAERYDGRLEDIFAIQDEITTSVVGRIGPELLTAEHLRASRKPTHSLDAWECVIRALSESAKESEEGSQAALALLDRALAADPDYAQALGMKAWILVFRAFQGWEDMAEALVQAQSLIVRAAAADSDEPWQYLAQAMVGFATRDNALSLAALERALAINPNFVNAHGLLALAHAFGGRATESLACIEHAKRLSPRDAFLLDFHLFYAFAYFQEADYARGFEHARQSHQLRPGHPTPAMLAAACAGYLDHPEAAALVGALRAIMPAASPARAEATSPFVRAEDRARLAEGLSRAGLG